MYIDYEFYKDNGGSIIEENDFERYAEKAENIISIYTFDRVNDSTIDSFPSQLVLKIKNCACELSDLYSEIDKVSKKYLGTVSNEEITGIVKSETAGAVSKTYDTSTIADMFIDPNTVKSKIKSIINSWLYPCKINGIYYNVLSWVM